MFNKDKFNDILNSLAESQAPEHDEGAGIGPGPDLDDICEDCKKKVARCLTPLGYNDKDTCKALDRALDEYEKIRYAIDSRCQFCKRGPWGHLNYPPYWTPQEPGPCYDGPPNPPRPKPRDLPPFPRDCMEDQEWCDRWGSPSDEPWSDECVKCQMTGLGLGPDREVANLYCGIVDCIKNNKECIELMKQESCCPTTRPIPFPPFPPGGVNPFPRGI